MSDYLRIFVRFLHILHIARMANRWQRLEEKRLRSASFAAAEEASAELRRASDRLDAAVQAMITDCSGLPRLP